MQCSMTLTTGNIKMKTINNYKNPYKKEYNNKIDQLCSITNTCEDIDEIETECGVGMPTCSIEQAEAVRRYYAAFPALKKTREAPPLHHLPPPAWCHRARAMHDPHPAAPDHCTPNNKPIVAKERRDSYHGHKRNRKRRNCYRSFEENLPEWVTHEGVWDMDTQDPVKEFIRAIALDEGYGTCENTITDELREIAHPKAAAVPDWDDGLDLVDSEWVLAEDFEPRVRTPVEDELYAKFEAKFDRSIEALWAKDQATPDDEYQDLPIDFHDLLASPSDDPIPIPLGRLDSPGIAEALHDCLRPLNLADPPASDPPGPAPPEFEPFALYDDDEIYDALAAVAGTLRSFTVINHSRDRSGFAEVVPRRARAPGPAPAPMPPPPPPPPEREDLLTSARTHFRPIRRETEAEATRYADGDTFDIRGDLDPVEVRRSESGGVYVGAALERYLEYRGVRSSGEAGAGLQLRFPLRQHDAAVQTEPSQPGSWATCEECGRTAKKMRAGIESIWSTDPACKACAPPAAVSRAAPLPQPEELSREWDELLSDISAMHAQYTSVEVTEELEEGMGRLDRKRRHSAALRCAAACTHPHARFLPCCALALDRPLTR